MSLEASALPAPIDQPMDAAARTGAVSLGVVAFLTTGVMPILLGGLSDMHRITVPQIGLAATSEALAMGLVAGLAGLFIKPRRLRSIGLIAVPMLAALDVLMPHATGVGVILVRALSGVLEGVLLWMLVGGMIVRTAAPARWFGILFMAATSLQLLLSAILETLIFPAFGLDGGFYFLGAIRLLGIFAVLLAPNGYDPLPHEAEHSAANPPPRGWIALAAALLFIAAGACVSVFLVPLAHEAGLDFGVAHLAQSSLIAAQIPGSALATVVVVRLRYLPVFLGGSIIVLLAWLVYAFDAPAWLFIAATATLGFINIFLNPFLMPMIIEADPSRRAAVQAGAVQLLGLAFGPLLASCVVNAESPRTVLILAVGLLLTSVAIMGGLRVTTANHRKPI